MNRAFLPFRFLPSAVLVDRFGKELFAIAVLAVKAVLKQRKSLEIAHQQIVFRDTPIALSTRILDCNTVEALPRAHRDAAILRPTPVDRMR